MTDLIRTDLDQHGVLLASFNRPEVMNAINGEMVTALQDVLRHASEWLDEDIAHEDGQLRDLAVHAAALCAYTRSAQRTEWSRARVGAGAGAGARAQVPSEGCCARGRTCGRTPQRCPHSPPRGVR